MSADHLIFVPVLLPLAGAAAGMFLSARPRAAGMLSLALLGASLAASVALLARVWSTGTPLVLHVGGWQAPIGITLVADLLSATMAVMCQFVLWCGLLYALGCKDKVTKFPGFYPLFLTMSVGLTGAMLTGDLFNLFVFAELLVISGTVLTAASDHPGGTEAAYKYFYISTFAAVWLLLACGCLYVSYGTLNMADLARRIAAEPPAPLLKPAVAMLLAAFMIKSAVVPFHFWQPDFHNVASTPVSAMLSSVVVKLGVYGFLRMMTLLFVAEAETIAGVLLVTGLAGVVFGGLGAVGTHDAKRMLAYSTLAQIGFILVALSWASPSSPYTGSAIAAAIVFTVNHSLVKSAMLMLAGVVSSRAQVKSASFDNVVGVGRAVPWAGVLFLAGGMALIGMPPTNGFIGKLAVLLSGVHLERYGTVAVLVAASMMTLVYVSRSFQLMWWRPLPHGVETKPAGDSTLAPAILVGSCVVLGIWAQPLVRLANDNGEWLQRPAAYIQAVFPQQEGRTPSVESRPVRLVHDTGHARVAQLSRFRRIAPPPSSCLQGE